MSLRAADNEGLVRPIFVAGPGRSGTTIFYHMLSRHRHLAWFSSWVVRYPTRPELALFSRLHNLQHLERFIRRIPEMPTPSESLGLWEYFFPGHNDTDVDWTEAQVSEQQQESVRRLVHACVRWQGRKRFLAKRTGFPMFRFIRAIFPDACLLYIHRDPRAVVMSRWKLHWGYKTHHADLLALPMREQLDIHVRRYLHKFDSLLAFEEGRDYFRVCYENLVQEPIPMMQAVCAYCDLTCDDQYRRIIAQWDIHKDTNKGWKIGLDAADQDYLTQALQRPLRHFGYQEA